MCNSKDPPRWWRDRRAKQNPFRARSHVLSASRRVAADEVKEEAKEDKEEGGKPLPDDTFETEIWKDFAIPLFGTLFRMSGVGKHGILRGLLPLMILATLSEAQFRCPEPKGFFPDPEQCDLYYACADGQPEERLCKDGLVFRDDNPKKELCDIPANVPCGDRSLLRKFR